jgi:hypothetical protein
MLVLSDRWGPILTDQPETGMGYQIATILLKDGRRFSKSLIVEGRITKISDDPHIPFKEEDIAEIIVDRGR